MFAEMAISYQQRKQKLDYFELKTLKVGAGEVDQMLRAATLAADELYQLMRTQVLEQSIKRLLS